MEHKEFPFGDNWDSAKAFVNQLTECELVQFFYETFGEKTVGEKSNKGEFYWKGHYALAEVSRTLGDDNNWGAIEIEYIARHNSEQYTDRVFGNQSISQAGACAECKAQYRSYRKHLICPVCKSKGYGT